MSRGSGSDRGTLGGRQAIRTMLSNQNEVTGRNERIALYTTLLDDGSLFYLLGVAPDNEFGTYDDVFDRIAQSLQFSGEQRR
jgi:hypothetical protein